MHRLGEVQMINIIGDDGCLHEYEVVLRFTNNQVDHDYIAYTKHERNENGKIVVHYSILRQRDAEEYLDSIPDDEWEMVKAFIDSLINN